MRETSVDVLYIICVPRRLRTATDDRGGFGALKGYRDTRHFLHQRHKTHNYATYHLLCITGAVYLIYAFVVIYFQDVGRGEKNVKKKKK